MPTDAEELDDLFRQAVAAVDAGDVPGLTALLHAHPRLAHERLEQPGSWLRDTVGSALDGFFTRPFLLWFVAEDPVRRGQLPPNIADVARSIIEHARRAAPDTLDEQLHEALRLVCWSWIAHGAGVQIALLDVLLDAGASSDGGPDNALVNGHVGAAAHLVSRGAPLTLSTALCLGRVDDAARLAAGATPAQKQFALTMCALRGQASALSAVIGFGVELGQPSAELYSHATALHHAVSSGSLDAVRVLVEAGAPLRVTDSAYGGTPLDWAEFGKKAGIAAYLRDSGARSRAARLWVPVFAAVGADPGDGRRLISGQDRPTADGCSYTATL